MRSRAFAFLIVSLAALAFAGCEKPGASHVTSPSALALLGTTSGAVSFAEEEAPPDAIGEQPDGWNFVLENARFSELEDGAPSIQVVNSVASEPGLGMEIWISDSTGTRAVWRGGESEGYSGTVCFQLRLEHEGAALTFPGAEPLMTIAFVDSDGAPVVVESIVITGTPLTGDYAPPEGSDVLETLLGCPRSVI